MKNTFIEYLRKINNYLGNIFTEIRNKSIVDDWRKSQEEDERYVKQNIDVVREEIQLLKEFLEQNPYHLKALDIFTEDERGYGNPVKYTKP